MIYPLTAVGDAMDRGTNTLIGSARADVVDPVGNIGIAGVRVLRQQIHRSHDHARLAVSALRYLFDACARCG